MELYNYNEWIEWRKDGFYQCSSLVKLLKVRILKSEEEWKEGRKELRNQFQSSISEFLKI